MKSYVLLHRNFGKICLYGWGKIKELIAVVQDFVIDKNLTLSCNFQSHFTQYMSSSTYGMYYISN